MGDFSLTKGERLCQLKAIERLFKKGKSYNAFPLRCVWLKIEASNDEDPHHIKVLFSVAKKRVRKATDRNYIKRILRESYRQNKSIVQLKEHEALMIAFIYTGQKEPNFIDVKNAIQHHLEYLKTQVL